MMSCEHAIITLSQLYHYRNITRKLQTVKCKDQWSLDRFGIDIMNYYYGLVINSSIIFPIIFLTVLIFLFTTNKFMSVMLKSFRSFRILHLDTLSCKCYTKTRPFLFD